ncbi:MAG: hypothetical protein ACI83B_001096 [Sediminicola sp.]|jgi:hypothetical protein
MNTRTFIVVFFFLILSNQKNYGQGFSNEFGLTVGPIVFYSDYGSRNNFETNSGNVGYGVGFVHFINFTRSSGCKCYTRGTFWNDHFKLRNEIDYHVTNFKHRGPWVDPNITSITADQLRGMRGSTTVFELGTQIEYFPFSIRDFEANSYKVAPFVSVGVHWVSYDTQSSTDFGAESDSPTIFDPGGLTNPDNVPEKYINAFNQQQGNTWTIVTSIGARYKITRNSDLLIDARWNYYFSDWVDGLNPSFEANETVQVPENQSNDWVFWLKIGYIYYLD